LSTGGDAPGMAPLSAREALSYAISPAVLRLFGVVAAGAVLFPLGVRLFGDRLLFARYGGGAALTLLGSLVGFVLALVGFLALYGGLVALLYKLLVDARRATPET
jgi:hypothetical protein